MKNTSLLILLTALICFSCSSTLNKIFHGKETPHEKYVDELDDNDLDKTPEGRLWLAAARKALDAPHSISLPYSQGGYFNSDKPRSLGLKFRAKHGERLTFTIQKKTGPGLTMFADLFNENGIEDAPLLSADTSGLQFYFDVEQTGNYILRLQPELFRSGAYSLSISVGASLGFPVSGKANVGSVWGDGRDGGKRKHEGIDIFAAKRSPAVAAADGYITGVKDGGIGGKTVWLRPSGKNYTLYYAHLDRQLVVEGQTVKKGDVVGLVGNTGNARHTAPHLHFGIYTFNGPIDPLPFVDRSTKTPPSVPSKTLDGSLKLVKSKKTSDGLLLKASTELVPVAVTAKGYLAETADGNLVQLGFDEVRLIKAAGRSVKVATVPAPRSRKS